MSRQGTVRGGVFRRATDVVVRNAKRLSPLRIEYALLWEELTAPTTPGSTPTTAKARILDRRADNNGLRVKPLKSGNGCEEVTIYNSDDTLTLEQGSLVLIMRLHGFWIPFYGSCAELAQSYNISEVSSCSCSAGQ